MKAYVLYAVGQAFIDKVKPLMEYLIRYSSYDVVLCYSEGTVNFTHIRLKTIYMDIPYVFDFNVLKQKIILGNHPRIFTNGKNVL